MTRTLYRPDATWHLWDYSGGVAGLADDPRGGSDLTAHFDSFAELRDNVRQYLDPLNIPFSWHWHVPDEYSPPGEPETLAIAVAQAYRTVSWICPIRRDQEPEVRELLAECAAYQARIWAPALGPAPSSG